MSLTLPLDSVALLLAPLLAGFGLGLLYFEALRRTVARFTARDGWPAPVALTVGRMGVAAAVLAVAARAGAATLLVTFLGFLLARTVALHRSRRAG
jgi:F1F0 ATPase subunit 2